MSLPLPPNPFFVHHSSRFCFDDDGGDGGLGGDGAEVLLMWRWLYTLVGLLVARSVVSRWLSGGVGG